MKIFYIINARMPTSKAYGLQVVKTIEAFKTLGADVALFLPRRKGAQKELNAELGIKDFYNLREEIKTFYFPDFVFFIRRLNFKFYYFLNRCLFVKGAFFAGLFSRADFIYTRDYQISFLLSFFRNNIVYEDHEPRLAKIGLYAWFLKRIRKKVVVAVNMSELYDKFGVAKKRYVVAPNGVDLSEFEEISADKNIWTKEMGFKPSDKVILYVGHFYEWKGVYTLVDSVRYLPENIKLVLIGGMEEDREKIVSYAEKEKIEGVFVQSFVPHKKVLKYIKSADVLALPNTAREERSNKYTTPIKLFEYMASGVPIVASRIKSFEGYLKDGLDALLFEPDNAKDLAEKINFIISNKEAGSDMATVAFGESRMYTWEKRAGKILKFLVWND